MKKDIESGQIIYSGGLLAIRKSADKCICWLFYILPKHHRTFILFIQQNPPISLIYGKIEVVIFHRLGGFVKK